MQKCELCKRNNITQGMYLTLIDVNGSNKIKVCQPCLKKLKNAWRGTTPVTIEIYPVKSEEK